ATNPIEIRGQGNPGGTPFGVLGFNTPTMLAVNYSPPFFHNGSAETLEDVFAVHLVGGQTIDTLLGAADRANLLAFLKSIDGRTTLFQSQADCFKSPACNLYHPGNSGPPRSAPAPPPPPRPEPVHAPVPLP